MNPYWADGRTTLYQGDAREVLATLEAGSVQTVVTSPPYWGLRDYGLKPSVWGPDCPHEWGENIIAPANDSNRGDMEWTTGGAPGAKVRGERPSQGAFCRLCGAWKGCLGLEPTPELYVEHIAAVFREVRRVLRDDGTVWLNLGDSYARSPARGIKFEAKSEATYLTNRQADEGNRGPAVPSGCKEKDLVGIPWMVAFALRADGWWLRSDIVWSKPNPMPESVQDRPTRSHEYVFLLAKRERYYYDIDAIREPHTEIDRRFGGDGSHYGNGVRYHDGVEDAGVQRGAWLGQYPAGRNKRTVWEIATQPYPEAHFATFPEELVKPCILAGTSERGQCECGAPWERVTETARPPTRETVSAGPYGDHGQLGTKRWDEPIQTTTTGWRPTCSHSGEPVPQTVLDPFGGSGTTAVVARKAGRTAVLIELSEDYCKLASDRMRQAVLL